MPEKKYGHKNKIKWVLIEEAPVTASGLNEILAGAETKAKLTLIAKVLGYSLAHNSFYKIIKVEESKEKND